MLCVLSVNNIKKHLSWDKETDREILLFRQMRWDDPQKLLKQYSKEELRKIFFKFYFRFDRKNKAFWKLVLEIGDEEIEQKTKGSIRGNCNI